MALEGWPAKITVWCIKVLVLLHDIITLPIYFFMDKPWKYWRLRPVVWVCMFVINIFTIGQKG